MQGMIARIHELVTENGRDPVGFTPALEPGAEFMN